MTQGGGNYKEFRGCVFVVVVVVLRILPKIGVRWPILALVGVGTARKIPGERFGTVVDGVRF